ncbi:Cuticle protein 14 isoform b [Nymphon striatum]|nr:Cuticle protein 14 isoform b [Nymphon striatum]
MDSHIGWNVYVPNVFPLIVSSIDAPAPYEMGYDIVDEYGNANGRRESGDAAGNKAGSYTINLADGRKRIVEYKADKHGFRAIVRTNEPGTDASQDPADVDAQSLGGYAAKPAVPVVVAKAPSYGYVQKAVVAPAPSYAYETGLGGHGGGYGYDVSYGAEYGAYGRGQGAYGPRKGAYGYGGTGGGYSRSYNRRAAIPVYKGSRYHSY